MVTDEVSVFNLALNSVGARNNVQSTAEASREAEVCRLWYSAVRDQILSAATWPSARSFKRLAAFSEIPDDGTWVDGSPEPGFQFAFHAPADMLRPRNLTSFGRFTLGLSGANQIISANEETPILAYTSRQAAVSAWDSELQMAVAYGLAAHICMPLTGKASRAKLLIDQANALVLSARVGAANSDDNALDSLPDWLAARGVSTNPTFQQYLYPTGPLLSAPVIG